jgi:hypothetical protein
MNLAHKAYVVRHFRLTVNMLIMWLLMMIIVECTVFFGVIVKSQTH